ncbi:MAG TPA: UDP-N-acetylmuramate--L-alanine ligase [Candidatus Dormibacteraeota bacterium]|nr:UDP-N-acetylmuramate--L-alanine ligase [Candidatus Dormibacteraeota bacterium]
MNQRSEYVHFVGIGGIGMSALARVLLAQGVAVSGSDLSESTRLCQLRELGARTFVGHAAENVAQARRLVVSSAIAPENPEVRAARDRGIPIVTRGVLLAEMMEGRYGIAIAGTHGKTTTTTMVAAVLEAGGLDPTVLVGGEIVGRGVNAKLGGGEYLVAESDESDGSFLELRPRIAVITNIENDHLAHYGTFEALAAAFGRFAELLPDDGLAVIGVDCPETARLARVARRARTLTTGLDPAAELTISGLEQGGDGSRFVAVLRGRTLGEIALSLPGVHNVANALHAVAVGLELAIPFEQIARGLAEFRGVRRRFDVLYRSEDVAVVDDYAHHPTAVATTIAAARQYWPGRVIAAFQPHRYTRTAYLIDDFARALVGADEVVVADVYSAGEDPVPGVSGEAIAERVRTHAPGLSVTYVAQRDAVTDHLVARAVPGTLLLCMGAGDITARAAEVAARLRSAEVAPAGS